VTALIPVASNNDFGGGPASQVTFNAVAGTAYQIAVDGLLQEAGQIRLTLTQAVAPPSPRLEPLPYTGDGSFQFTFLGQANANYFIEGTTNLINWLPITNVVNSPGPVHISDPEASLVPLRFYRVRVD
jgi:hypothetical protein